MITKNKLRIRHFTEDKINTVLLSAFFLQLKETCYPKLSSKLMRYELLCLHFNCKEIMVKKQKTLGKINNENLLKGRFASLVKEPKLFHYYH